ncbi:MAG: hypothetical protein ACR2QK_09880 [Acidimicrobiales bacterium]
MAAGFDRSANSVGNIVQLEHVNLLIPDQGPAVAFYISGLRFTRDPFLMVGLDNMWINMGRNQMHLPHHRTPQLFQGTIGLVVPDLDEIERSLGAIKPTLEDTKFSYERVHDRIEATGPWGNRFRVHGPAPEFGTIQIGMPYLELDAPAGSAQAIGRFYSEIIGANVEVGDRNDKPCASVTTGNAQYCHFVETGEATPGYDGHHVAVYLADFAGPYDKLLELDLITVETDAHEWRFVDIVDLDTGDVLFQIEHEVRSVTHPLFGRPLINRNPAQSNVGYRRGQDNFLGEV